MKLRNLVKLLAPAALLLALSTVSFAGIAPNGSFGFALLGCCSLDGSPGGQGDLLTAGNVAWGNGSPDFIITTNDSTTFGNPNDFFNISPITGDLSPDSVNTGGPADVMGASFGLGGIYSFTSISEIRSKDPLTRAVSYYFMGTFHDSTGNFGDATASLTLQFTQSAPNTSISGSGTFSTPPVPFGNAPEPATMGLFGSALVGLGLIGRKRLAR